MAKEPQCCFSSRRRGRPNLPYMSELFGPLPPAEPAPLVEVTTIDLTWPLQVRALPRFERPLEVKVREGKLLTDLPWVRSVGKLPMDVGTVGWKMPAPPEPTGAPP